MLRRRRRVVFEVDADWFEGLVAHWMRHRIREVREAEDGPPRHHWQTRQRLGLPSRSPDLVEVPLSESPAMPLPAALWRPVGTDAVATPELPAERVPPFFARLGVVAPIRVEVSPLGGVRQVVEGDVADRSRARLLRACDLVLAHERSRTEAQGYRDESGVASVADVRLVPPSRRTGARLSPRRRLEPRPAVSMISALTDAAADEGRDEILIATLYLLSEPGETPGAEIDETWVPYVRHREFWPLQYRERYEEERVEPTRLAFDGSGLGTGTLDPIARDATDELNALAAGLEAQFATVRAEGRFFTL